MENIDWNWSLDDLLRYLTKELGYEEYAALCEMWERLSTGELPLTRQRHVNGKPYSPTDGKPYNRDAVKPSLFRSNYTLDLDHLRDQVRVVSRLGFDWWDFCYRVSEQKARAICWSRRPPTSQTAPGQEDSPRDAEIVRQLRQGLKPGKNIRWKEFYPIIRKQCNPRPSDLSFGDEAIRSAVRRLRKKIGQIG